MLALLLGLVLDGLVVKSIGEVICLLGSLLVDRGDLDLLEIVDCGDFDFGLLELVDSGDFDLVLLEVVD